MKITTKKRDIKITPNLLTFIKQHCKQYDSILESIEYVMVFNEDNYSVSDLLGSGIFEWVSITHHHQGYYEIHLMNYELNDNALDVMSIYKI